MIAVIQDKFEHSIADKITGFLEHPTAPMIKEFKRYTDLLTFDKHNDWHKWQSVSHLTKLAGTKRAYVTYNKGGQQGGVARLSYRNTDTESSSIAWYVWNLGRNPYVYAQRIPSELVLVERSDDDYQAIKLVLESTYGVETWRILPGQRRRHGFAVRGIRGRINERRRRRGKRGARG